VAHRSRCCSAPLGRSARGPVRRWSSTRMRCPSARAGASRSARRRSPSPRRSSSGWPRSRGELEELTPSRDGWADHPFGAGHRGGTL